MRIILLRWLLEPVKLVKILENKGGGLCAVKWQSLDPAVDECVDDGHWLLSAMKTAREA